MLKKLSIISAFALFYAVSILYQGCSSTPDKVANLNNPVTPSSGFSVECPKATEPFASYLPEYEPPKWYCQEYNNPANRDKFPIFQLSQNYPTTEPAPCTPETCPWTKYDFTKSPRLYLQEVLKYTYKNNIEKDWVNPQNWYNTPWMHPDTYNQDGNKDAVGREFMRGMTVERTSCHSELNWTPTNETCGALGIYNLCDPDRNDECFASWAISFYNDRGSNYLKKVWDDVLDDDNLSSFHGGFPNGTMAVKFLFTDAMPKDAAYLENSVEWRADIVRSKKKDFKFEDCVKNTGFTEECFPTVRLLQIDIAVRDDSKDAAGVALAPTGWVFATFAYNSKAPEFIDYDFPVTHSEAEKDKIRAWLRVEPVGLTFGNDPTVKKGGALTQSINNEFTTAAQHFGCNGRTNGPVDNPKSSCLSCHALSETPANLAAGSVRYGDISIGCEDETLFLKLFRNINPRPPDNQTSATGTISLDYSLQLREGIFRYCIDKNKGLKNCVEKVGDKLFIHRLDKAGTSDFLINEPN